MRKASNVVFIIFFLSGEWWNANVIDVENEVLASGGSPNNSDAYTINGQPGDLYPCSKKRTYIINTKCNEKVILVFLKTAIFKNRNAFLLMIKNRNQETQS